MHHSSSRMSSFIKDIVHLISVYSIIFTCTFQFFDLKTGSSASSIAKRLDISSDSVGSPICPKLSSIATTLVSIADGGDRSVTPNYPRHTKRSSSGKCNGAGPANAHSSKAGSGRARNCLDHSNLIYEMCFQKAIAKSPPLAVRFAGRNLRVAQICQTQAHKHLQKCYSEAQNSQQPTRQ